MWRNFLNVNFVQADRIVYELGARGQGEVTKLNSSNTWGGKNVSVTKVHHEHERDRKSTRLNSSHVSQSRMPSSA